MHINLSWLYIFWHGGGGEWTDNWNSQNMEIPQQIPPSYAFKIQGNPGAGKTFIICTNRNITKNVMGAIDYNMAPVTSPECLWPATTALTGYSCLSTCVYMYSGLGSPILVTTSSASYITYKRMFSPPERTYIALTTTN
jgi:hypothetical protein